MDEGSDINPFLISPKADEGKGGVLIDFVQTIVIALAIVVIVYLFIAIPNQVDGPSMQPTFYTNDLLLTNKTIQLIGTTSIGQKFNYDYKRGDVVIFKNRKDDLIKRVIAVSGDTVSIENSKVIINGKILEEEYIDSPTQGNSFIIEGETKRVPEGSYFLMGDNRVESHDSRFSDIGFVERKYLKGRVFLRYWPIKSFGIIKTGKFTEVNHQNN